MEGIGGQQSWNNTPAPEQGRGRLVIRFEVVAKEDATASAAANHPVFKDVEYIEKRVPGDKQNVVFRPVNKEDIREFEQQYKHWKSGQNTDGINGMPLLNWPPIQRSQVEHLAFNGVRSVEDLAGLSDSACQNVGSGSIALRQKARDWLETAAGQGHAAMLRLEIEAERNEKEALKNQVRELSEAVEKLQKKANK